jgi:hypothetical protein
MDVEITHGCHVVLGASFFWLREENYLHCLQYYKVHIVFARKRIKDESASLTVIRSCVMLMGGVVFRWERGDELKRRAWRRAMDGFELKAETVTSYHSGRILYIH